jgi:hypothetical protein
VTLFRQGFLIISVTTSWHAPALQLYINCSVDCESKNAVPWRRVLEDFLGRQPCMWDPTFSRSTNVQRHDASPPMAWHTGYVIITDSSEATQHITLPSSLLDAPLTPPPSDEKAFTLTPLQSLRFSRIQPELGDAGAQSMRGRIGPAQVTSLHKDARARRPARAIL